jgi:hypothetical protein
VTLAITVVARAAGRMVQGVRYGSAPHLRVVQVVAVPAKISARLLEAGGQRRGGMSICLTKEAALEFFSRQDSFLFEVGPH